MNKSLYIFLTNLCNENSWGNNTLKLNMFQCYLKSYI